MCRNMQCSPTHGLRWNPDQPISSDATHIQATVSVDSRGKLRRSHLSGKSDSGGWSESTSCCCLTVAMACAKGQLSTVGRLMKDSKTASVRILIQRSTKFPPVALEPCSRVYTTSSQRRLRTARRLDDRARVFAQRCLEISEGSEWQMTDLRHRKRRPCARIRWKGSQRSTQRLNRLVEGLETINTSNNTRVSVISCLALVLVGTIRGRTIPQSGYGGGFIS